MITYQQCYDFFKYINISALQYNAILQYNIVQTELSVWIKDICILKYSKLKHKLKAEEKQLTHIQIKI